MMKESAEAVREQLETRRQRALALAAQQQDKAYARCAALYGIDARLAQAAMEIAAAAMQQPETLETVRVTILALQQERAALLADIGMKPQQLLPQYSCTLCGDTGYASGKRCTCWQELYCIEAGKRLPAQAVDGRCSFHNFSLDYYPEDGTATSPRKTMQRIAQLCAEYAAQVGQNAGNLLFIGKTGLGKTHLSLAIAGQVAQRGRLVRYTSAQGIIDCFERTRFGRSPTAEDWDFIATASSGDLLVIDDLGSEFITTFSQSVLYNLLNDRMMSGRETVISTNLDAAKLAATYEQRISSRLLCGCRALGFAGKDIRLLQQMQS